MPGNYLGPMKGKNKMTRPRESIKESEVISILNKDSRLCFTEEQEAVLAHDVAPGQLVLVKAIAGAGKTATLIEYMRRRSGTRFLYLAYNRSAIDEVKLRLAAADLPTSDCENIVCRTIDSLAAGSSRIKFRGPKKWSSFWFYSYPAYLEAQAEQFPLLTERLMETFENQALAQTCGLDVFSILQDFTLGNELEPAEQSSGNAADELAELHARFIWQAVVSGRLKSPDFSWTVKAVAQLGERLDDLGCPSVDILIVDEAQDINYPMWDIVKKQVYATIRPVGVLMVGDPNQHLYGFRKCVSIFDDVCFPEGRPPTCFNLTRSCRFGPSIAQYANQLLRNMSSDMTVGTLHTERQDRVQNVGFNFPRELFALAHQLPEGERAVVLFQSNKLMFSTYIACSSLDIEILGSAFGAGRLTSLWSQYQEDPADFTTSFKHKSEMAAASYDGKKVDPDAAETLRDDLLFSGYILQNSSQVPGMLNRLERSTAQNSPAKIVFSTVHQAKGREFHTVVLHPGIRESKGQLERRLRQATSKGPAEVDKVKDTIRNFNYLYYTAVTRARFTLILT